MKLLIWSQYFWPENFLISKLAAYLSVQGIEVTVVTGKPNYPDGEIFPGYTARGIQREDYEGVEIIRIPLVPRGKNSAKWLLLNYLSFIFSGYFFAPLALRGRKFDAVFVYAPSPLLQALPAIFVSWLKHAPLILWVQDIWPEALQATGHIKNKWLLSPVKSAVRYIYHYSDSILIQSEAFRTSVQGFIGGKGKIHFYPNFAEDLSEAGSEGGYKSQVAADIRKQFSVVFAGNIGSAQSCETIVSAAELLCEHQAIRFYLVGTGSKAKSILQDIKRKRLTNIVMTGQLPAEEMPSIFSAASILLVSLKENPALSATIPSKLQSYMSAGRPIVASLNGESARIVDDSNAGLSCSAEDPEALAKSVLQLYDTSIDELDRLGENARNYFKKHFYAGERVSELIEHLQVLTEHR